MKSLFYILLQINICFYCGSCSPSPSEQIFEIRYSKNKGVNNRFELAAALKDNLKFLKFGSANEDTIRLGGNYVGAGRQGITIWVKDGLVTIFAAQQMTKEMENDFTYILETAKRAVGKNESEIKVRNYIPWGINVQ